MKKIVVDMLTLVIPSAIGKSTGSETWPGFTNSDEICPVCGQAPGSEGCTVVGTDVEIEGVGCITVSHSASVNMS